MTDVLKLPNGDIIREGEYGVTRDGQKVGPIVKSGSSIESEYWFSMGGKLDGDALPYWFKCGSYYPVTSGFCDVNTMARDIVAKWVAELPYGHVKLSDGSIWDMTADKQYPFGMLTDEQQAAMRDHGGPYQYWNNIAGWFSPNNTAMHSGTIYRVAPKPTRQTVVNRDMYLTPRGCVAANAQLPGARRVTITYDTIDGMIDYATYKVEAR